MSNGRLIFGVGVGYLEPEFRALGAPFEERGRVTDEYLAAIRAIWTEAAPAYRGRFAAFERVQAHPQPVQKPTPPIVIGGHTKAAFRRAVQQGHGWYGFALDTAATTRCLEGLREAAATVTRPPELPPLEISVSRAKDRPAAAQARSLGVHRLVLIPQLAPTSPAREIRRWNGSDLVGHVDPTAARSELALAVMAGVLAGFRRQ